MSKEESIYFKIVSVSFNFTWFIQIEVDKRP
jgi:hypothetical protein